MKEQTIYKVRPPQGIRKGLKKKGKKSTKQKFPSQSASLPCRYNPSIATFICKWKRAIIVRCRYHIIMLAPVPQIVINHSQSTCHRQADIQLERRVKGREGSEEVKKKKRRRRRRSTSSLIWGVTPGAIHMSQPGILQARVRATEASWLRALQFGGL